MDDSEPPTTAITAPAEVAGGVRVDGTIVAMDTTAPCGFTCNATVSHHPSRQEGERPRRPSSGVVR